MIKFLKDKHKVNLTKIRAILLISAFSFLVTGCSESKTNSEQKAQAEKRPNIVLIMTDDQGYGDLAHNNNPIIKTPTLDSFANQSVKFTNFHVDPTCSPTRAALMSGQYSLRAGVWHTVMGRHLMSDKIQTLPEALKEGGYKTAIFGKWHLGDNYPFRPQEQGFDHVLIHGAGGVGQTPDYWANTQFDDTYFLNGQPKKYEGYATDVWFNEAIDYVKDMASSEAPFFLYIPTNAPHSPFRAPEEYIEPYRQLGLSDDLAAFYGMITNVDDNIARLQKELDKAGLTDNTIFIFLTDNGSVLGEHSEKLAKSEQAKDIEAKIGKKIETLNYFMRGKKASTYDGGHRVPIYVRWPNGGIDSAKEIDSLAAHFDLKPTLLDLVGLDISNLDTDGISWKNALVNNESLPERVITVTNQRVLHPDAKRPYSVMEGDWRLVKADGKSDKVELFNVASDPGQQNDLTEQNPEVFAKLSQEYDKWWQHATKDGVPTMRPIVGTVYENPTRLTSHDWLAPHTGQVAWFPGFVDDKFGKGGWIGKEEKFVISPWKVKSGIAGNYRFTVSLHDIPAKKVINHTFAHLDINGTTYTAEIEKGAATASFDIDLPAQELDIKAWFNNSNDSIDKPLAAFYLYVERLESAKES
ncbi:arylsulfatase [Shewanella sp. 10N.7]|uniref:arylsulfatase n=1 Tax=Shewanella sp. 10N.7 TaxID=2885093 RepID=UPI002D1FACF3|nr:arylsulfatase [Shewanella sp. 10N.7]MCC4831789.1 arylsulfatase [Shewanella sp. 10N.7]